MPPDGCEDVFTAGSSRTEGDTGFGLAIVGQIVEAHGWTMTVTDGTEGGARFESTNVEFGE